MRTDSCVTFVSFKATAICEATHPLNSAITGTSSIPKLLLKLFQLGQCLAAVDHIPCQFQPVHLGAYSASDEQRRPGIKQNCIAFRATFLAFKQGKHNAGVFFPIAAGKIGKGGWLEGECLGRECGKRESPILIKLGNCVVAERGQLVEEGELRIEN